MSHRAPEMLVFVESERYAAGLKETDALLGPGSTMKSVVKIQKSTPILSSMQRGPGLAISRPWLVAMF